MPRSLEEIEAQEKELAAEKKQALKEHKKNAVATVKKLIVDYKLTKGDIRGKALKQWEDWMCFHWFSIVRRLNINNGENHVGCEKS